jgi:hypothetical protein
MLAKDLSGIMQTQLLNNLSGAVFTVLFLFIGGVSI